MRLEIELRCVLFPLIILEMFLLDWRPPVVIKCIGHDLERHSPVYIGWPGRASGGWCPQLSFWPSYSTRCHRKAKNIIKDINHPSHGLLTPVSSRRRGQYRCIKDGTERLKNSFYLKDIRLLKLLRAEIPLTGTIWEQPVKVQGAKFKTTEIS